MENTNLKDSTIDSLSTNDKFYLFLDEIDHLIIQDINAVEIKLNTDNNISYSFYLRITEIFHAITVLIQNEQPICASMLLRPLSEAYILMKSSLKDPEFNKRYSKYSASENEKWLQTILKNYDQSGFHQGIPHFEKIKEETYKLHSDIDKNLQKTRQLFELHDEFPMYIHIYSVGSYYLHTNQGSLSMYFDDNGIIPTKNRNQYGRSAHTTYSAAAIMALSYDLLCNLIEKDPRITDKLFERLNKLNEDFLSDEHKNI